MALLQKTVKLYSLYVLIKHTLMCLLNAVRQWRRTRGLEEQIVTLTLVFVSRKL